MLPTGFEDLYPIPSYLFANNFWEGRRQILFHYSNCSYSQSKKSSNVYLSAPSIQLLTLWPPGKLLQLNNTGYADHSVSFKYLTAMQRQFLYSFPYTHETARHDKTLPRDKRFQCGFTEGKVGFLVSFFFFFFSKLFGRFVYTWMEAWPARQNQETAKIGVFNAVKKKKENNITSLSPHF